MINAVSLSEIAVLSDSFPTKKKPCHTCFALDFCILDKVLFISQSFMWSRSLGSGSTWTTTGRHCVTCKTYQGPSIQTQTAIFGVHHNYSGPPSIPRCFVAMAPAMLQIHADLAVAVVSAAHDFPSDLLSTEGCWEAVQRMDGLKAEAEAGPGCRAKICEDWQGVFHRRKNPTVLMILMGKSMVVSSDMTQVATDQGIVRSYGESKRNSRYPQIAGDGWWFPQIW